MRSGERVAVRHRVAGILIVTFVVVPLLELYVVYHVGHVIGFVPTLLLLLAESLLGGWLVRREGSRTWRALRTALGDARIPDRELADSALVLVGGTLLLTPGFLTDVVGFFCVLPPTRPLARRFVLSIITGYLFGDRVRPSRLRGPDGSGGHTTRLRPPPSRSYGDGRTVIDGEIVDE